MLRSHCINTIDSHFTVKLQKAFQPSILDIVNESHLHAHHEAMKGNTDKETHFRLVQLHRIQPISRYGNCNIMYLLTLFIESPLCLKSSKERI